MKLGFLTAAFPDLTLEQVASWAASEGFETLEIACWPAAGGERRRYASITHIASTRSTPTRCTSSSARTGSRSPRSPTTEQPPSRRGPPRRGQRASVQGRRRRTGARRQRRRHIRRQRPNEIAARQPARTPGRARARSPATSGVSDLLAGVEQALRVEDALDLVVELERARRPLALELPPLQPADAVLAGNGSAEAHRQGEQLCGRNVRPGELVLVMRGDEERRVQVAVTRVSPAAGDEVVAAPDRNRLVDRFAEPVEGDDDVLAHFAAAGRADRDRDAVAPAPELGDGWALGADDVERVLAENSLERGAARCRVCVERPDGQGRLGSRQQPQPGSGDDPERALRADEQALEVVARDVLADRTSDGEIGRAHV